MKYLSLLIILIISGSITNAQTTGSTPPGQKKPLITKQEKKRLQRGTGQYYGSRDTTPGSPMGTGGAGGDMSGSPAASAIETDDRTSKANATTNNDSAQSSAVIHNSMTKKPTVRKTSSVSHRRRS